MKVWLNHWFSTAYYFIDSLKKSGYYVISSNKRETCVYSSNSDEFYIEPDIENEEYLEYCLDFCVSKDIDVFFPRKGMKDIILNLDKFNKIGVKVLCERNIDWYNLLNSKVKTASYFSDLDICNVPLQLQVKNLSEFEDAYKKVFDMYGDVCIKYDCDEGGQSYKHIAKRDPNIYRISENNGLCYDYDYICSCLGSVDSFSPIVVMPYLNGREISVDCLGLNDKLIAVPRYKLSNRVTCFEQSNELLDICNKFYSNMPLISPFNIQFRYHNDKLYLLEVNTRLSGGSWKAKYIGVDFVKLAVGKLLGINYTLPDINFSKKLLSNLEGCIEL